MKGKMLRISQPENSSPSHASSLRPISFKKSKSKSKSRSKSKSKSNSKSKSRSTSKSTSTQKSILNPNPNNVNVEKLPYFIHPEFTDIQHGNIVATLYYAATSSSGNQWLYALTLPKGKDSFFHHPLTSKPHRFNRRLNVGLLSRKSIILTSSYTHATFRFDKLVFLLPMSITIEGLSMVVLHGGGTLLGRVPSVEGQNSMKWFRLSEDKFDDIVTCIGCTYVVDRLGRLYVINNITNSRDLSLGRALISRPIFQSGDPVGYRKRLFEDKGRLYLVVRVVEDVFRVFEFIREMTDHWDLVESFNRRSFFVSKDTCFSMDCFGGKRYYDCMFFTESSFPEYGDDGGWKYDDDAADDDDIWVFKLTNMISGKVGVDKWCPNIDWSPPSWIFEFGGVQSDSEDSTSEDEEELEWTSDSDIGNSESGKIPCDSSNQENEDVEMQSNANIEGDTSLLEKGKKTDLLVPEARPSSSIAKDDKGDSATAKFKGVYDIRSDLVPTLEKIWRNHGNIMESSPVRSGDIRTQALESLAVMVQILECNKIGTLSESDADFISGILSDLRIIGFNVEWLSSYVEKAVSSLNKLQKSKGLLKSLDKLQQSSSQIEERRDKVLDKAFKLTDKQNKLKAKMLKLAKSIPLSGKDFNEPFGAGLS